MSVVERAKAGDQTAWAELYGQASPRLLAYLRCQRAPEGGETVEDLLGETWLIAAQKIHSFSGEDSAFTAWLFTVARQLLANSHRKASRRRTDSTDDHRVLDSAAWDSAWEAQWPEASRMLEGLDERERSIIVLVDLLDFSSGEAGSILGMKSSAVRVARMRALKKARKSLTAA